MIVSVTRLRLRSWRYLLPFARLALASHREARAAPGVHDSRVLADRRLTFWTVTRWHDEAAMLHFVRTGTHARAMPLLKEWCDQGSVVRWDTTEAAFPSWQLCHERMAAVGRQSFVRHPAPGPIDPPRNVRAIPAR